MRDRTDEAIVAAFADCREAVRLLNLDPRNTRPTARSAMVLSPWRSERTPSCHLSIVGGELLAYDHGSGEGGDIFALAAAVLGLDPQHDFRAVKAQLGRLVGVEVERGAPAVPLPRLRRALRPEPPPLPDERFAAVVAPLLHLGRLDGSDIAANVSAYIAGRGLLDRARAEGWFALPRPDVQRSWAAMLYDVAAPAKGYAPPFTAAEVERCGLFHGQCFTFEENRLCIPWRTPEGAIYTIQRRRLDGQKEHKYVFASKRPARWPYGVERVSDAPADWPLVLVEGAVDVLAIHLILAARNECAIVLGVPGVTNWRASWGALARGRVAVVAFDVDAAGEREVHRVADDLADGGARQVERWKPDDGFKDWDEAWAARAAGSEAA